MTATTASSRAQLTLDFEPAMPERWATLRDFIRYRVEASARPAKSIAADLDIAPSTLSRKLAPHDGDTQRFNCDDLERYMALTGDTAPIEYLAAKFLQDTSVRKALALARVESLATELNRTIELLKGDAK